MKTDKEALVRVWTDAVKMATNPDGLCCSCKWFREQSPRGYHITGMPYGNCCLHPQTIQKIGADFCSHWASDGAPPIMLWGNKEAQDKAVAQLTKLIEDERQ